MKRDVTMILSVATEALEAQKNEVDPSAGANGHLYYLVKALAEVKLTKQEQQQIEHILDLHRQCAYPLRCKQWEGVQPQRSTEHGTI